jgi:hypothetical protein
MSANESDSKKIAPVKAPLPPVEVNEVTETDLDDVAGGCTVDSCNGVTEIHCGMTTNTATGTKPVDQ